MPAYNFQKQFAPLILAGVKTQTIRPRRKRPTRVGDALYLYTGMRTKHCQKLIERPCMSVEPIRISDDVSDLYYGSIWVSQRGLSYPEMVDLSRKDGFPSLVSFFEFFTKTYGNLFEGELIKWEF